MNLATSKAGSILKMTALFLAVLFVSPGNSREGFAHVRHYVWSTEYQTLPKNEVELESYVTTKVPDHKHSNANTWEYQEELEYGVTDHLTLAHYELWETINKSRGKDSTTYKGFKFEGKYRIGERGKYFMDPLLYFEIKRDPRKADIPLSLEGKIVLSKDMGKLNAVYNQIIDSEVGDKGRTKHEYTFGLNYEIFPEFYAGVEMKGDYWKPKTNKNGIALGPTLAYEAKYFWMALGALFGVNHHADDYQVRLIVGVPF